MVPHLFAILYLVQVAQGTTNTTGADSCPPLNETSRSVWSILGSCAVTLLICIWHTIHFPVLPSDVGCLAALLFKGICVLTSFFTPELLIAYASQEWWTARKTVKKFRAEGYEWSMTHSFFALMGGFVYCDERGSFHAINADDFLWRCRRNEIRNPFITVKDIRDRSKSDWLGKAVLALQLVWFMLQVVVRGSKGLAVTLVELDTVCMGVLSLLVIVFWWDKPLRPDCQHVFYSRQEAKQDGDGRGIKSTFDPRPTLAGDRALSNAWKPEPFFPNWSITCCISARRTGNDESNGGPLKEKLRSVFNTLSLGDDDDEALVMLASLCVAWFILGALHLIAWNFEFPTEVEKIMWRVVSLILAGGSVAFFVAALVFSAVDFDVPEWIGVPLALTISLTCVFGVVSRAVLVGLMLASLRALPCSAHQTVSWTIYIPHL